MRYKAEYMMRVLVPAGIGIMLVGASFFPSSAQQSGPTAEVASAAAAMHDATSEPVLCCLSQQCTIDRRTKPRGARTSETSVRTALCGRKS